MYIGWNEPLVWSSQALAFICKEAVLLQWLQTSEPFLQWKEIFLLSHVWEDYCHCKHWWNWGWWWRNGVVWSRAVSLISMYSNSSLLRGLTCVCPKVHELPIHDLYLKSVHATQAAMETGPWIGRGHKIPSHPHLCSFAHQALHWDYVGKLNRRGTDQSETM